MNIGDSLLNTDIVALALVMMIAVAYWTFFLFKLATDRLLSITRSGTSKSLIEMGYMTSSTMVTIYFWCLIFLWAAERLL